MIYLSLRNIHKLLKKSKKSFKTEGSLQRHSRLHEKMKYFITDTANKNKFIENFGFFFEKFKDCEDRFLTRIIFVRARNELESLKRVG